MPVTIGGSGPITGLTSINTTVSDTELGYLDGVTSALQTQINTAGGLVKITDSTFSGSSAVNVNNCFTSTYENYRITLSIDTTSVNANLNARLRLSGTDASGANYNYAWRGNDVTNVETSGGNNAQTLALIGNQGLTSGTGIGTRITLDIFRPAVAVRTIMTGVTALGGPGVIVENFNVYGASHTLANAYDGISFYPASGTFGGTIRIYGYRD